MHSKAHQPPHFRLLYLALLVCIIAIGTSEFALIGILPTLSTAFAVSEPTAGWLVTAYALGVGLGSPLITACTQRLARKPLLMCLMLLFVLTNLLSLFAGSFAVLLTLRILSAMSHGTLFAIAVVMAVQYATPQKRGAAVGIVTTGVILAMLISVPFGTYIGQTLGWMGTYALITGFGVIGTLLILWALPRGAERTRPSLRQELAAFKQPQVLLTLAITIFGFGGLFAGYTYFAVLMGDVTRLTASGITLAMLVFGIGAYAGSLLGNRFVGLRRSMHYLIGTLAAFIVIMLLMYFFLTSIVLTFFLAFLYGASAFAMQPLLQERLLLFAHEAPTLVSAANMSAFNVANALGAYLGGLTITAGFPLPVLNLTGALLSLVGTGIAIWALWLEKRQPHCAVPIETISS
jgi:DHA1 family inner membrane transport protein